MTRKDSLIFTNKEMNEQSVIIENMFKMWLESSGMSEEEFISLRTVPEYKIEMHNENGYCVARIGYIQDGNSFVQVGENFVFEQNCENGYMDLFLLLVLMSNKLDNANASAPKFENRPDYFLNITKDFINKNISNIYSR